MTDSLTFWLCAPASVLFHWKDKLKTFCPGIRATIYHGTERDADRDLRKYQVLLTSYGTLRNDAERFARRAIETFAAFERER